MKIKILSANFNPATGESIVKLQTKYGVFTGKAKLHPDDKNHISNYAGCHIAEYRAWIKYFKHQLTKKKSMLVAIQNLQKDIQANCYENLDISKRLNLAIRNYTNEIKEYQDDIAAFKEAIQTYIKIRDEIKETKVKTE